MRQNEKQPVKEILTSQTHQLQLLSTIWNRFQGNLFPWLNKEIGEMTWFCKWVDSFAFIIGFNGVVLADSSKIWNGNSFSMIPLECTMPKKLDPDTTPSQKLLRLYALLLFSGKAFSLTELADKLNCSKQTVMRLADQLSTSGEGFLEDWEDEGRRWFRIQPPSRERLKVALKPEEIQHLLLYRDFVQHMIPNGFLEEVESTIAKASSLLPDLSDRPKALTPIGGSITKGQIDYTPYQANLSLLLDAIRNHRVCNITYRSPNGSGPKTFHAAPFRLVAYRETLYAHAWRVTDEEGPELVYDDVTPLAIHRIVSVEVLDRVFVEEVPEEEKTFGVIDSEPFKVCVRFETTVADYVKERSWSEDQIIKFDDAGRLILELTASSRPEVISWVLGFGENAELMEPADLRNEIKETLAGMAKRYSEG